MPATAADRAAAQSYRSGRKAPVFSTNFADPAELRYDHIGLEQYPAKGNNLKHTGMGWGAKFMDDLSSAFDDYGVLWTPTEMIFEKQWRTPSRVVINHAVEGPTDVAFSSALIYVGVPDHPGVTMWS